MAFLTAIPFAITEGAALLAEAGPVLSTISGGITNILAFTGASSLISEAVDAFKGKPEEPKKEIKLPQDPTLQSHIMHNPAIMKKEQDVRTLMNRSLQNL